MATRTLGQTSISDIEYDGVGEAMSRIYFAIERALETQKVSGGFLYQEWSLHSAGGIIEKYGYDKGMKKIRKLAQELSRKRFEYVLKGIKTGL